VEKIEHNGKVLAIIDNVNNFGKGLKFYGDITDFIQVGAFRYDSNKELRNHRHIFRPKLANKTQEIMIVFTGSCAVRTYTDKGELYDEKTLEAGDFYISYWGGCGFTILQDDTIMMEIKNGPHDVNNDDEDRELL
jgi:hypothetical protein